MKIKAICIKAFQERWEGSYFIPHGRCVCGECYKVQWRSMQRATMLTQTDLKAVMCEGGERFLQKIQKGNACT